MGYIQLIAQYSVQPINQDALASQESRVVWSLLWLAHESAEIWGMAPETEVGQLSTALIALRALMTGESYTSPNLIPLPTSPAARISSSSALEKQCTRRRLDFWTSLVHFVVHLRHPNASAGSHSTLDTVACEASLESCRTRLDNFENRDVVYSIMLMQYLAKREELGLNNTALTKSEGSSGPQHQDEYTRKRLEDWATASGFLQKEASGRAMNLVCANVAGIALRAWDWS